jgi:RHS repeat-associated protein
MTFVASGKLLPDSTLQATSTRKMLWDEENRLQAVSDNGFVSNYWYDASGERTVKESFDNEGVYVNGVLSAGRISTGKFTAYVSPYLVVNNGGYYSKHIYIGSQRIMSKLGSSEIFHDTVNPIASSNPANIAMTAKLTNLTGKIQMRFDSLGVIYRGTPQGSAGLVTSETGRINTPQMYFYHSDHLGSSSLITDNNGTLVQHLEYVPFGEVFVEENKSTWSTPYKFTSKELDAETGLYYFGARYYDPKTSVWLSVDLLAEGKPWMTSYHYCSNNPVNKIDPDGRNDFTFNKEDRTVNIRKTDEANRYFVINPVEVKTGKNSSVTFEMTKQVGINEVAPILNDNPGLFAKVYNSAISNKERSSIFNATVSAGKEQYAKRILPVIFAPLAVTGALAAAPAIVATGQAAIAASKIATDYTVYGMLKAAVGVGKAGRFVYNNANLMMIGAGNAKGVSSLGIGVLTGGLNTGLPYDATSIRVGQNVDFYSTCTQFAISLGILLFDTSGDNQKKK